MRKSFRRLDICSLTISEIVFRRLAGCDEAFDAFEVNHLFTSFLCSEK